MSRVAISPERAAATTHRTGYKAFVVTVIVVANILNYADRMILSVLAEPIKHDLGASDAQIGFLYGTSFVLFNSLAGLAIARVADGWVRNRLLALGVLCWSGLTALSGLAHSLPQLAMARFGVGLGEATIGPVGHSLLGDLFAPKQRGRIFALYLCGPFIGSALCVALAGKLLGAWPQACVRFASCGLRGWQAAFFAFGLPGLVVGLLALGIGEPVDRARRQAGRPWREGLSELAVIIPPFPLFRFGNARLVRLNLVAAAAVAVLAALMALATHDIAQWIAVGIALYAAISWAQGLPTREPLLYRLTLGSPAYRLLTVTMCIPAVIAASMAFWTIPLALRTFGLRPEQAGATLGLAIGGGSLVGTLVSGWLGDRLRRHTPVAAIGITTLSLLGSGCGMLGMALAPDLGRYALALAAASAFGGLWSAPSAALVQELLVPAVRARGAAVFSLTLMLVALCLGPYVVGRLADTIGSLRLALGLLFTLLIPYAFVAGAAARALPGAIRTITPTDGPATPGLHP